MCSWLSRVFTQNSRQLLGDFIFTRLQHERVHGVDVTADVSFPARAARQVKTTARSNAIRMLRASLRRSLWNTEVIASRTLESSGKPCLRTIRFSQRRVDSGCVSQFPRDLQSCRLNHRRKLS